MFTSRAEYRLLLREDNADSRLTPLGRQFGLVDDERMRVFENKREVIEREQQRLCNTWVHPDSGCRDAAEQLLGGRLQREYSLHDLLRRPDVDYRTLMTLPGIGPGIDDEAAAEQLTIQAKYAGYIERQHVEIERHRRHEATGLPDNMDYDRVTGLSFEVRHKLKDHRPATIGQASRISGVTPAAISLLLVYLKKQQHLKESA